MHFVEINSRLHPSTMDISDDDEVEITSEADFIHAAEYYQLDIVNQAIEQGVNINCANVRSRGQYCVVSHSVT